MYFILPAYELASEFKVWTEEFTASRSIDVNDKELDDYIEIVKVALDDIINVRTQWCANTENLPAKIGEVFEWFDHELLDPNYEELELERPITRAQRAYAENINVYYRYVIDHVNLSLGKLVDAHVFAGNWNIWFMRRFGDDILIEKGEDYRIVDWERRMESGEWTDDD